MFTLWHVGLNFTSAILEFSLFAVNDQINFYRYIKIVASTTNYVFSSLISDRYVIQRPKPHLLGSHHLLPPSPFYFHLLLKISMDRNN